MGCYTIVKHFLPHWYTPEIRAQIGKYSCQHGTRAASALFSRKLLTKVSQLLLQSIKLTYLEHLKRIGRDNLSDGEVAYLPPNKRGRPFLLGEQIDKQLQLYLKKVRDQGGVITASVVVVAAHGILMSNKSDRDKLVEFGGHINLSRQWAYHLLGHMNYV